jgi:hypothetical protein
MPVIDADKPLIGSEAPSDTALLHQRRKPPPYRSILRVGRKSGNLPGLLQFIWTIHVSNHYIYTELAAVQPPAKQELHVSISEESALSP